MEISASIPSRAYTSFLLTMKFKTTHKLKEHASMPSRAYTSFLLINHFRKLLSDEELCQCPLGLIPHFYFSTAIKPGSSFGIRVNALSGLYLISTVPLQKPRFYAVSRACFCRYLSEYSDNSRFSCMLTFWTYLMRCTYP